MYLVPADTQGTPVPCGGGAAGGPNEPQLRTTTRIHVASSSQEVVQDGTHSKVLHGICKPVSVTASVHREVAMLMDRFAVSWKNDLTICAQQVRDACPEWIHLKETLLQQPNVITALIDNPRCGSIGVVAREIRAQFKLLKRLRGDGSGALWEPELIEDWHSAAALGVTTVAYTFFLHAVMKEFPKLQDADALKAAVDKLRRDLAPTGVKLTPEMDECLETWATGVRPKYPAPARVAPAPAAVLAESAEPVAAPAALAPDAVVEAGAVAEAPPAPAVPVVRMSLAERARAAKRKRD